MVTEKKKTSKKSQKPAEAKVPAKTAKLRGKFKELLLQNPNYFGNVKPSDSAIKPMAAAIPFSGNTTYEEIGCVGFQPQLSRLEAVVFVKQPTGYGGKVCSPGTPEYVRFYLSFDNGASWEDQGVTSFTAFDIPEGTKGAKRLEYATALEVAPGKRWCKIQNTILARAILSWNFEPPADQPDFKPVWGNVHDTHILVDPYKKNIAIGEFFKAVDFELDPQFAPVVDSGQKITLAKPKELSVAELSELYKNKVEPHRFGMTQVQKLLDQPGQIEELIATGPEVLFPGIDVDITDLIGKLQPTDGSTFYEELECVGLDNERDELVAVIRIKKPQGFSGDPCSHGSTEYVTFWGDFNNNGNFEAAECLGTAQVQVYDISQIPEEGLEYSLQLPVNLNKYRQECQEGPRIVPIRAILSWQAPPPCYNPNYVPVWGNREETLVQIRPGRSIADKDYTPFLYSLCNLDVCSINQVTGWATSDRPYGGVINIQGEIPAALADNVADQLKYKVWVRSLHDNGTPSGFWQALTNNFRVTIQEGTGPATAVSYPFTQSVDPVDEYYTYREYGTPPGNWRRVISPNRQLARWNSTDYGRGLWEIMIRAKDSDGNHFIAGVTTCLVDGSTRQNVKVKLDQTRPVAEIKITGFTRGGGGLQPAKDCATFQIGDVIHGDYSGTDAPDDHFGKLTLGLQPKEVDGVVHGVEPTPSVRSYYHLGGPTGLGESGSWTLNTAGLEACGYTVRLVVSDRTIANCSRGRWDDEYVGFCLVEPS